MATVSVHVRMEIRVQGIVQGVGFRPFVYSLATSLGLAGLVGNDTDGVFAQVEGPEPAVAEFLARLEPDAPPLARIDRVTATSLVPTGAAGFVVAPSDSAGPRRVLVSPDAATCADCLRELADPADRRFGYAFINCTNCGPRLTIVKDVPYDRAQTTMASFEMCEQCAAEYRDPANRRFHAQPTCCPVCGPRLVLAGPDGAPLNGDPLAAAATLLDSDHVLAIKGLGGYHLACDASSEAAAAALRNRKHREDKPFALMAADVATASRLCVLDEAAAAALTSARRPIVLLPRREDATVAVAVAPGNRQLGVMLPYTALHHLLLAAVGRPLVLTSGNVSDEPIAYRDDDARSRLADIADAFLSHDRPIHMRADDSVVRIFGNRERLIRRSRGYAPEPLPVAVPFARPVLACGAELKNTFCLAKDDRAFISQHIGDLQNAETLRSFTEGVAHFGRLFEIAPRVIAHDLHPDYLSTKYALALAESGLPGAPPGAGPGELELCAVQHHHAHIASCLADNAEPGPVIGVAFDGTGYGTDGTIWGGEFLTADLAGFERAGHLALVPMPGGAAAITQPWRMAAAYLDVAFPAGDGSQALGVARRNERFWHAVTTMARRGVNSPLTSSVGRLFDAAAAILDVRDAISYEGQAAIELEQLADPEEQTGYRAAVQAGGRPGEPILADGADLIRAICADLAGGVPRETVAARFHQGVVTLIEDCCVEIRDRTGLSAVALSGGVFQNLLLLGQAVDRLETRGFRVLLHARVPCNDGGISLGQAVVAGARDRLGRSASPATLASRLR
jgi:hydrogenase maturation protein HypF